MVLGPRTHEEVGNFPAACNDRSRLPISWWPRSLDTANSDVANDSIRQLSDEMFNNMPGLFSKNRNWEVEWRTRWFCEVGAVVANRTRQRYTCTCTRSRALNDKVGHPNASRNYSWKMRNTPTLLQRYVLPRCCVDTMHWGLMGVGLLCAWLKPVAVLAGQNFY